MTNVEIAIRKFARLWTLAGALLGWASTAHAVDGCKLLLCLAGNWSAIPQCVPTVVQAFRDLWHGHPFPTCAMSGGGNSAFNEWPSEATCPPMYSLYDPDTGHWAGCQYGGLITVQVNGVPWSDVFWTTNGQTSTHYYPPARSALGSNIDPTYDNDLAAYVPPAPPPPPIN